jgi:hypothetical protein
VVNSRFLRLIRSTKDRIRPYLKTLNNRDAYLFVHLAFFLVLFLASFATIGRVPLTHIVETYPDQIEINFNSTDLLASIPFIFENTSPSSIRDMVDDHSMRINYIVPSYLDMGYSWFKNQSYSMQESIRSNMHQMNPFIMYQSSVLRNEQLLPLILYLISIVYVFVFVGYIVYLMYFTIKALTQSSKINLKPQLLRLVMLTLVGMIILRIFGYISGYHMTNYSKTMFSISLWGYLASLAFDWARSTQKFKMRYLIRKVILYILLMISLNSLFEVRLDTHYEITPAIGVSVIKDYEPLLKYLPSFIQNNQLDQSIDAVFSLQSVIDIFENQVDESQPFFIASQQINSFDVFLSGYVLNNHEFLNTAMMIAVLLQIVLILMLTSMIAQLIKSLNAKDPQSQESSLPGMSLFIMILLLILLIYVKFTIDSVYVNLLMPVVTSISFSTFIVIVLLIVIINQENILKKLKL